MADYLISLMNWRQTTTGLLDTEHALIMLLVLFALLTFNQRPWSRLVPLIVLAGLALSVITPVHDIDLLWPVLSGVVVPPLMWGAALAVTRSGSLRRGRSLVIWLLVLAGVAASLFVVGQKPLGYSLLISIMAVTLIWTLRELTVERSYLSTLGLVALAILLLEIDVAVISPRSWMGTLIAGVAFGLAVGFISLSIYRRLPPPVWRGYFWITAYIAYLTGLVFGVSPIATTLATAIVVATYGYSTRLWPTPSDIPAPGQSLAFFTLASIVWLVLGWQAHIQPGATDLTGILAAMVVVTLGIIVIRNQVPLNQEKRWSRLVRKEIRVLLLLVGASFFWPLQADLTVLSVEIAILSAVLVIFLLRQSIKPIFDLFGIHLDWPSGSDDDAR